MRIATVVPIAFSLLVGASLAALPQASVNNVPADSHEGLTVSAQPWLENAQYKTKFPKKSPLSAGVVAVEVSFRNDSPDALSVALSRIRLSFEVSQDNRQELQPLTPVELADAILRPGAKDPTATRKKIPLPVGSVKGGNDKERVELQRAASDAAVPTNVVAPRSTVQGLLYFDLQGQFDLLNAAHLYVPDVTVMERKQSLTFFDVDLSHAARN